MPTVPCAQLMTGQPPFGALPLGIATSPETATALLSSPLDVYSRSVLDFALFSTGAPVSLRCQIGVPWAPLGRAAGGV